MAIGEFANSRFKAPAADFPDLETKASQDASDAELHIQQLGLQQLAADKQGPNLLAGR